MRKIRKILKVVLEWMYLNYFRIPNKKMTLLLWVCGSLISTGPASWHQIQNKIWDSMKSSLKWRFLQRRSDSGAFILHYHAIKYEVSLCLVLFSLLMTCISDDLMTSHQRSSALFYAVSLYSGQPASAASDREVVGHSSGERLNLHQLQLHVESAPSLQGEIKVCFFFKSIL